MCQVEFQYKNNSTIIQCNEEENMSDICKKFISKAQIDKNNIYFSYNGKAGSEFNEKLTYSQMINSYDKERKLMNILVFNIDEKEENKSIIKSKNIICPKCGENIKMKIKDYKISLFECKNGHKIDNLSFDEFEKTQNIDLSKIICNICKKNPKMTHLIMNFINVITVILAYAHYANQITIKIMIL